MERSLPAAWDNRRTGSGGRARHRAWPCDPRCRRTCPRRGRLQAAVILTVFDRSQILGQSQGIVQFGGELGPIEQPIGFGQGEKRGNHQGVELLMPDAGGRSLEKAISAAALKAGKFRHNRAPRSWDSCSTSRPAARSRGLRGNSIVSPRTASVMQTRVSSRGATTRQNPRSAAATRLLPPA